MAIKAKRIPHISPYIQHRSVLSRPAYRNVIDMRDRFQNDAVFPDAKSASKFLNEIWSIYAVVREAAIADGRKAKLPATGAALTPTELFYFQLRRRDFRQSDGPRPISQIRRDIDDFMKDGMLPDERRVVALLEDHLGEKLLSKVQDETIAFHKSLQPAERFQLADQYFQGDYDDPRPSEHAYLPFIKRQKVWRGRQSYNACQALFVLERALMVISPINLQKLEARYHVAALPDYAVLPLVAARTARIAICIASHEPVTPHSSRFRLDFVQAALVARKYNAFLNAQDLGTPRSIKSHQKSEILSIYQSLI